MNADIRKIELKAGDVLFREGDGSRSIYVLENGAVEIRRGSETISFITEPGSYLGEMSFLLDRPRSGTAVAMERSMVLAIGEEEIERSVASNPKLALKLAQTLAHRLERTTEQLKDLLQARSARARVENFDDFLAAMPYSRREQVLLETAQFAFLGRGSGLSLVEARIRMKHLEQDLAEMREQRDLHVDPVGHVAGRHGLSDAYEKRLRAEFGRIAG